MSDNPALATIEKEIAGHDIVLFMKGSKKLPQCGFSATVASVLERLGIAEYRDINVLADPEIREGIKQFSNWPTIPQLYVKGEFVGGCDIIREMFETGELATQLSEAGVPCRQPAKG